MNICQFVTSLYPHNAYQFWSIYVDNQLTKWR